MTCITRFILKRTINMIARENVISYIGTYLIQQLGQIYETGVNWIVLVKLFIY
jgi:hypothetical protein